MHRVHVGPASGLLASLLLLLAIAGTLGLDPRAVALGIGTALVTFALLERGMRVHGMERLGPANRVTLTRATLIAGIAALVAQASIAGAPRGLVVGLSVVALVLDGVDGQVARRTGSITALGAAFDMETDAYLILILSIYVAPQVGWWVLAIGLARYALLVAGAVLPWLAGVIPVRPWAKVVAAIQGIVLTVVAADLLPTRAETAALLVALALLAESFGRQIVMLWRQRRTVPVPRGPWVRPAVDVAAVALLWALLMLPHRPSLLSPWALLGIPVELLTFLALAMILPLTWGRVVAVAGGVVLAATVLISVLDLGFYVAFDRPFDLMNDPGYASDGLGTLRSSVGAFGQVIVLAGIAIGVLATLTLCVWSALRVRRAAHTGRRVWLPVVTVLTLAWAVAGVSGAEISGVLVAAAPATGLISGQVEQVQADIRDGARFEQALSHDPYAGTPARSLLTGLRGKDVLVVFVESYGRVATDGSWFAPQVQGTLARDTHRLATLGFGSRSSYLRSPTFGGISWLAHSTLQSGLWIDSQQRYDDLMSSNRLTLTQAFHRAGWQTVADIPSNTQSWSQGRRFYHYDRIYSASDVGYHGPRFSYAEVPDQYTFAAFTRNVLAEKHRRPVMAEIDLDSSHEPWVPLPHLVPWDQIGDGSIYNGMVASHASPLSLVGSLNQVQQNYATSIRYALDSLVSFVQHAHDKNLVMVVLGDHQPSSLVSGMGASHDVPISLIAHSPAVLSHIRTWGWNPGLLPHSDQSVLGMDRFRNMFFQAFGPGGTAP